MTNPDVPTTTRELRSILSDDGRITLATVVGEVPAPGPDDVVIKVQAAPINPSDLGLLLAGADVETAVSSGTEDLPAVSLEVSEAGMKAQASRLGQSLPTGNEGAGTVIAAGSSPEAQALMGKVVGFLSRNSYAEYRTINALQCLPMADGTDPADAAAAFVNPLTALGMVETMKAEGHTALIHTVGASNLGLMLNRVCLADGVDLVNIVRKPEQVEIVKAEGAKYVIDSSQPTFDEDLLAALRATGATIAFDAIGGGELAGQLLSAMEKVASESMAEFSRYGSDVHKQVYIYGGLDRSPTLLRRDFGLSWGVSGWLLTPFMVRIGPEAADRLRQRVADEITTTFASRYGMTLSLAEVVDPEHVKTYGRVVTGLKALVKPS